MDLYLPKEFYELMREEPSHYEHEMPARRAREDGERAKPRAEDADPTWHAV